MNICKRKDEIIYPMRGPISHIIDIEIVELVVLVPPISKEISSTTLYHLYMILDLSC